MDTLNLVGYSVVSTLFFFCFSGVMPPDEYYYNVNDSVYTNIVAKFRY